MIWGILFAVCIAQGVFLLSLLAVRGKDNVLATRLVSIIILAMIVTNGDFLLVALGWYNSLPHVFGISFGLMFLFGPLFYLYTRTIIDSRFKWRSVYWLHFAPYVLHLAMNMPWFAMDQTSKVQIIRLFLAEELPLRPFDLALFIVQDLHLTTYLALATVRMKSLHYTYGNIPYVISISQRMTWLKSLLICFVVFLLTVAGLLLYLLARKYYVPEANYLYTLVASAIVYFVAYYVVLNPSLIQPDFARKYKSHRQFAAEANSSYAQRLRALMEERKVFTDPDLNVAMLGAELGLQPYQVSQLVNERFGKSFSELVAEYRVREFIARVNDPQYQNYTVYALALDVGFNSKSSFNSCFKKFTGKTPSEFRKTD